MNPKENQAPAPTQAAQNVLNGKNLVLQRTASDPHSYVFVTKAGLKRVTLKAEPTAGGETLSELRKSNYALKGFPIQCEKTVNAKGTSTMPVFTSILKPAAVADIKHVENDAKIVQKQGTSQSQSDENFSQGSLQFRKISKIKAQAQMLGKPVLVYRKSGAVSNTAKIEGPFTIFSEGESEKSSEKEETAGNSVALRRSLKDGSVSDQNDFGGILKQLLDVPKKRKQDLVEESASSSEFSNEKLGRKLAKLENGVESTEPDKLTGSESNRYEEGGEPTSLESKQDKEESKSVVSESPGHINQQNKPGIVMELRKRPCKPSKVILENYAEPQKHNAAPSLENLVTQCHRKMPKKLSKLPNIGNTCDQNSVSSVLPEVMSKEAIFEVIFGKNKGKEKIDLKNGVGAKTVPARQAQTSTVKLQGPKIMKIIDVRLPERSTEPFRSKSAESVLNIKAIDENGKSVDRKGVVIRRPSLKTDTERIRKLINVGKVTKLPTTVQKRSPLTVPVKKKVPVVLLKPLKLLKNVHTVKVTSQEAKIDEKMLPQDGIVEKKVGIFDKNQISCGKRIVSFESVEKKIPQEIVQSCVDGTVEKHDTNEKIVEILDKNQVSHGKKIVSFEGVEKKVPEELVQSCVHGIVEKHDTSEKKVKIFNKNQVSHGKKIVSFEGVEKNIPEELVQSCVHGIVEKHDTSENRVKIFNKNQVSHGKNIVSFEGVEKKIPEELVQTCVHGIVEKHDASEKEVKILDKNQVSHGKKIVSFEGVEKKIPQELVKSFVHGIVTVFDENQSLPVESCKDVVNGKPEELSDAKNGRKGILVKQISRSVKNNHISSELFLPKSREIPTNQEQVEEMRDDVKEIVQKQLWIKDEYFCQENAEETRSGFDVQTDTSGLLKSRTFGTQTDNLFELDDINIDLSIFDELRQDRQENVAAVASQKEQFSGVLAQRVPGSWNDIFDDILKESSSFSVADLKAEATSFSKQPHDGKKVQFFVDLKMCTVFDSLGNLPLHCAVIENNLVRLKRQVFVLKIRTGCIDILNYENLTALQLGVLSNADLDIVRFLLESGADISVTDKDGNTLAHIAVIYSNEAMLNVLLHSGSKDIQLDACNFDGFTALMIAVRQNSLKIAEMLLSSGAEIDIRDQKSGRTALFHAIELNNYHMVQLMMVMRANTKERNFFGTSPHDAMFELDGIDERIKMMVLGSKGGQKKDRRMPNMLRSDLTQAKKGRFVLDGAFQKTCSKKKRTRRGYK